jgi:hypothetical protein
MTLAERAKTAKEAYIAQQTEQINRDFFECFQDIPDKVTFTGYRKADIKVGTATIKANRYDKYMDGDMPDEPHWSFYDEDGWDCIKDIEQLGFSL